MDLLANTGIDDLLPNPRQLEDVIRFLMSSVIQIYVSVYSALMMTLLTALVFKIHEILGEC